MIDLTKYLTEAVSRRGRHKRLFDGFPKDKDIHETIRFLESIGFEKYNGSGIMYRVADKTGKDLMSYGNEHVEFYKHGSGIEFGIYSNYIEDTGRDIGLMSFDTKRGTQGEVYDDYDDFRNAVIENYM